jgi:hypothetical protein
VDREKIAIGATLKCDLQIIHRASKSILMVEQQFEARKDAQAVTK